jgi:hypothetical protein
MSLNCDFYCEKFNGENWSMELSPHARFSPFLSLNNKQPQYGSLASLFFWPNALLPFYKGWPPESMQSDLCISLREREGYMAWLPLEALFLEDWKVQEILVTKRVDAQLACVFGDGFSPFPQAALGQMGMTSDDIQELRCGTVAERRVSRIWGRGRHELLNAVTKNKFAVTWADSISGYVGASTALAFQSLKSRGKNTRIVVCTA